MSFGSSPGRELDDRAGRGLEEVGEPAVAVDARERAVQAVHVVAAPARPAQPAGDERVHDHGVADRDVRDRRSRSRGPSRRSRDPACRAATTCDFSAHCPSWMCRSVRHSPAAPIRTITSSGPVILGSSISSSFSALVIGVQPRGLHRKTSSGSSIATPWRTCSSERQMPPLTSRLIRTSRAVRSQRSSSGAATGSPLGSTNAGRRRGRAAGQAAGAARRTGGRRDVRAGPRHGAPPTSSGSRPSASSLSHSRDWRATSALRRNSSRSAARSSSTVSPGNAPVKPSPRPSAALISSPV